MLDGIHHNHAMSQVVDSEITLLVHGSVLKL